MGQQNRSRVFALTNKPISSKKREVPGVRNDEEFGQETCRECPASRRKSVVVANHNQGGRLNGFELRAQVVRRCRCAK